MARQLTMKKCVFKKLETADPLLAWDLVSRDVVSLFAGRLGRGTIKLLSKGVVILRSNCGLKTDSFGEPLVPIPTFSIKRSPCAPGFVALRKERTLKEWLLRRPQNFLMTEFLWDFHPSWDNKQRILHSSSKYENTEVSFVYERSLTFKGHTKEVRVVLNGKEKSSLDEMPGDMTIDLENFEDSYFDDLDIYLVDTVYTCDSGFLEVTVDDDRSRIEFSARHPIGFTLIKLDTGYGHFPRRVRRLRPLKVDRWNGVWLDRTQYRHALHQIMPNQNKYGGGAGDVLGSNNTPFNLNG